MSAIKDGIPTEPASSITDDDFKEFLNEKVINHPCPCCTSNVWSILGSPEYFMGMVGFQKDGGFSLPPPHIPVYGVACNVCGYVRVHSIGVVVAWKSAKVVAK